MTQLSDFLANFSNVSSGLSSASTSMTAAEAIAQGDVIVQASDGQAYYAVDPAQNFASLRPIARAVAAYCSQLVATTTLTATSSSNSTTIALSNGNVGLIYAQSTNLYFAAVGADGNVAVAQTQLVNDYASKATAIGLAGGGFAVSYVGSGGYPRFAIFSSTGAVVSAAANIQATTANSAAYGPQLVQMTGGNIVAYYVTTGGYGFAIYTPAGTVAVAPTAVASGLAITACGTGFAIGYFAGANSVGATAYSASGVAQGNVTATTSLSNSGSASILAATLSSGNAVFTLYNGANPGTVTGMVGLIISPSGAAVVQNINLFSGNGIPIAQLASLSDGGFAVFYGGTTLFGQRVSAAGTAVGSTVTLDSSAAMVATSILRASAQSDGGITVAYAAAAGAIKLLRMTAAFTLSAAPVTTTVNSDNPLPVAAQLSLAPPPSTTIFLIAGATGSGVQCGVFSSVMMACQPVGVAKAGVPAASPVNIQVLGAAQTRLTFKSMYAVDARGNTPPGQKMSVLGNLAILTGVQ